MRIGIVGSEAAKFTNETELLARKAIAKLVNGASLVVSGGCHLGGIDIWAEEIARELAVPFQEHLPKVRSWEGYKARNILIAENSDMVVCITVKELPAGYKVRGFELFCYHCNTKDHVKSGGCWTVKYAKKLGKLGETVVIG